MVTLKYSVTAGTSFQIIYVFPTINQRECFQKIYERWGQRTFIEEEVIAIPAGMNLSYVNKYYLQADLPTHGAIYSRKAFDS